MPSTSPTDEPILNILGEKVALGPRRKDLLPLYLRWINDYEVIRNLGARLGPMTLEGEEKWWESSNTEEGKVAFTIYEREPLRPIGNTDLFHINHFHRTATFGIMIGEKSCWGKGYGTEATALMMEYGFTGLGLHNILLEASSFNERALRAYMRAGFKEIGRRREAIRLGGKAYDIVLMDCLSTEFNGTAMRHLLPEESVDPMLENNVTPR